MPLPCARGVLLRRSDKSPVSLYTRAGVTDTAERLLIGTAPRAHELHAGGGGIREQAEVAVQPRRAPQGGVARCMLSGMYGILLIYRV